jgi:hypothetical protein
MPACNLYMVSAVEIVWVLWWNTSSSIHFAEFHISKYLRTYTELWGRLVSSHEWMQFMNISYLEMVWQQCSEAQVQVFTEFPAWLLYHRHRYGDFFTMMVSIHINSKEYNISYQIMSTIYDFVNGCNRGYGFHLTFCSQMRPSLPGLVLPTQGIHTLGHRKIHTR